MGNNLDNRGLQEDSRGSNTKRVITIMFFKPSGKYYTEEQYEVDRSLEVYEIVDWVKDNVTTHKGMYAVITFKKDDEIGFPCMILAEER